MFVIPTPAPIAFTLFGFPIYWYGIIMALAIFISALVGNFLFNKINPDLKKDIIISIAPVLIICGIIGARLYFCLLNGDYYFTHPLEIFDIREGGLSIHGALIFGILCLLVVAFKNKISPLKILDTLACSVFLGQAIGRWGNYFNSEAFGLPVDGQTWGLFIPETLRPAQFSDYSLFHPTFLYESVLDLAGFLLLLFVLKKFGRKYKGFTFCLYLILYALIRLVVEQIRVDSALSIGTIPIAQIVSFVMLLGGIVGVLFIVKKARLR